VNRQQALLAGLCLSLAGCSSGPSDDEVAAAIKARMLDAASGGRTGIVVTSLNEVHCRVVEERRKYACKVQVDMDVPYNGHMKGVGELVMVKVNGAWTFDPDQVFNLQRINR